MPVRWRITRNQLEAVRRWVVIESIRTKKDPNIVIPYIKQFGRDTRDIFNRQVWPDDLRDWAPLKESTKEIRQQRGYNPEGPILHQSGQLRDLSTRPFSQWRRGQRSIRPKHAVTPYGDHTSIILIADINDGHFSALISGERVKHQTAYSINKRNGARVGVPARPFWGLHRDIIRIAGPESMEEFRKSWLSRQKGIG